MARPFVSVLIDTYNHERFIEEAVTSVLAQDFPASDCEVLVVDDGSTDKTPEILRKFEPLIRILRKANGGQASAFNVGIPQCRGDIIAFLDGDDFWVPNKLRVIADTMAADSSLGMIGHSFYIVSEGKPPRVISPSQALRVNLRDSYSAEVFRLHRPYLGTSRLALRAEIARKCLPVPEALIFEADEYLFTVASALSEGMILKEVLTHYRAHGANLFLAAGGSVEGERRKQRVLEVLASELHRALPALGVPLAAARTIVEIVEEEAAQHRLSLEGGWSWEVFQTEISLYRMQHAGAPWRSKAFRWLSMIPALLLPPRSFYALRRWLSSRHWYSRLRETVIPVPPITLPKASPHVPSSTGSRPKT
jgi:hypothetical protein